MAGVSGGPAVGPAAPAEVGLARTLSLFDVTMIGVGAMIGAGIFVLTGIGAGIAGPALVLVFALNGVVTLFTAMTYAELGSAIPEAGGGYIWVQEALGPVQSFAAGWMSWFAHAVAGSLYALGFGAYAAVLAGPWIEGTLHVDEHLAAKLLAVLLTLLFVYVNYRGASETGKTGNVITVLKVVLILVFIGSGLLVLGKDPSRFVQFDEFFPGGMTSIVIAMGLTFIAFEGYEIIAQTGEELVDSRRNIPRAVFLSLLIVVPIYILVAITAIGAVTPMDGHATSWQFLGSAGELGLVEAAKQFMPFGAALLIVGGLVSTMSALNATTFSSTRVAFAMGRDNVLPQALGRVSPTTRTPVVALLLSATIMLAMVMFVPIHAVAAAADIMFLLLFMQVNVACIRIRRNRGHEIDYGYRMPWFPVFPILAIILMAGLAAFLFFYEPSAWAIALLWIGAGLVLYFGFSKEYKTRALSPSHIVFERRPPSKAPFRLLVPIANPQTLPHLVEMAVSLAEPRGGEVQFLSLVEIPQQLPLQEGVRYAEKNRDLLEKARALVGERVPTRLAVRVGHDVAKDIVFTAKDFKSTAVLLGWRAHRQPDRSGFSRILHPFQEVANLLQPLQLFGEDTITHVIEQAPCDVIVLKAGQESEVEAVAAPVNGNTHDALEVKVALALGRARGLPVRVFHVIPPGAGPEEETAAARLLAHTLERAGVTEGEVKVEVVRAADVRAHLVAAANRKSLFVLGASDRPWWQPHLFGEKPEYVVQHAEGTVLLTRRFEGLTKSKLREAIQDILPKAKA